MVKDNCKLISVIIPCYNVEKYVSECIQSVLDNLSTYSELELICVNDGSTDDTLGILNNLAKEHKEIKVINQKNEGLSVARNTGLLHCNGDYISFIDSDDVISPVFYKTMMQYIPPYNSKAIVQCEITEFNDGENPKFVENKGAKFISTSASEIITTLPQYKMETVLQSNKIYNREIFFKNNKVNVRYPMGLLHEDEYIIANELINSKSMTCISSKLYGYRRNREGSITNKMSVKRVNDMVLARLNSIETLEAYRDKRCQSSKDFQNLANAIDFEKTTLMNDFMYMYLKLSKEERDSEECKKIFLTMKNLKKKYFPLRAKYTLFFSSPKAFEKIVENRKNG